MTTKTPAMREAMKGYARCLETHKPLPIGDHFIYGGSCSNPMVTNADVYVGFDMSMKHTSQQWPWEPGESVLYPIPDMGVPRDAEEFKKLIEWLAVQIVAQKLVHIGCIGGHGRTGTVMAALVTHMTGEKNSITYVRKHYCEKAVESETQVRFLNAHFGITEVPGAKAHVGTHGTKDWYASKGYPTASNPMIQSQLKALHKPEPLPKKYLLVEPTKNPIQIWGGKIKFGEAEECGTIQSSMKGN